MAVSITDSLEHPPSYPQAKRRDWIGLIVLVLACIIYAMDLTVLHMAVPSLSADLKPSGTQLLWIVDIYGFLVAGSLITMGTLGDRIGRRRLLLIGAVAFSLTSVLAAFSTSTEMLIASRALMGIAGATLAPSTLSLLFNMFLDPRQRSIAIGIWVSGFSAGGVIGPVFGGLLLEYLWWGSVFLLALPFMALLLVLGPHVLPEFRNPEAGRLDLRSALMSLLGVLAMIYGLKEVAQEDFRLQSVLAILIGLVLGFLFLRRQRHLTDPLIDLHLFRIPTFSVSLATNVLGVFVVFGYSLFMAQYLQLVLGLTPLQAGLVSLPSAIGFIVSSNVAPRFIYRLRPAPVLGACLTLSAVGLVGLTQIGSAYSLTVLIAATLLISLVMAPVFSLTTELIVGSAPPQRAGAASGISETGFEFGGALGIAILGSLSTAVYRRQLAAQLPSAIPPEAAEAAGDTLGAAVAAARQLPAEVGQALLDIARSAFVQGMQVSIAASAAIAIGTAIMVVLLLGYIPTSTHTEAAPGVEPATPHPVVSSPLNLLVGDQPD